MAEMAPWMNVAGSAQTSGMLCWQDIVYTEVCDPTTMRRVPYGERGTPVYTHLERTSQPMIRLVSGDLTLWSNEPNPCGRTYPRLPNGIFGRISRICSRFAARTSIQAKLTLRSVNVEDFRVGHTEVIAEWPSHRFCNRTQRLACHR